MPYPFTPKQPLAGGLLHAALASTLAHAVGFEPNVATLKPTPHASGMLSDVLLIGLVGTSGVGKDTAGNHLRRTHNFETFALAAPLRSMLHSLFADVGVDPQHLYEPHMKALPIEALGGISARRLMQTLGTEWGRGCVERGFWLRVANLVLGFPNAPIHDRIAITDVRFPDEAAWVKGHGGHLVRVVRPAAAGAQSHISEELVDRIPVDYTVTNSGTVQELDNALDDVLDEIARSRHA